MREKGNKTVIGMLTITLFALGWNVEMVMVGGNLVWKQPALSVDGMLSL